MTTPVFVIHSKPSCPYCVKAKAFLDAHGLGYTEVVYDPASPEYEEKRDALLAITNHRTFPQVFIGERFLGGCTELELSYATGALSELCSELGMDLPVPDDF